MDRAAPMDANPGAPGAGAPALAAPTDAGKVPAAAKSRALRITTETKLAVRDFDATVSALRAAVVDAGGYVSDARLGGTAEHKSGDLEARIPADKLAAFRAGLADHGEVLSDSEKAEDVTEQRADLKARLRNARAQEKRLLDLLSDRTGSLADVIAAEKALAEVRDTIERLDAQEQLLEGQISFATVKIHLTERREAAPVGAAGKIVAAGSRGVTLAGEVIVGVTVAAVTVAPTLLFLAAIGLGLFFAIRAVSRKLGWLRPRMHGAPPAR